jgi:putative glutamine amidotransferase
MPRIAIVPCRAMTDYTESVRRVGGDPIELDRQQLVPDGLADRFDGVLFTGGGDVDPALYGEAPHASYQAAEDGRDAFEIALARAVVDAGIPLFAICRGMQVLNVALGGTLVQDVPTMVNGALEHSVPEPRMALAHEVWVSKGTRLAALMRDKLVEGDTLQVNSRHHQAVGRLADGFLVSATSPDGVVEGMERPGDPFCVAVQWHPENFWRTGEFRPLFEGFVEAARGER